MNLGSNRIEINVNDRERSAVVSGTGVNWLYSVQTNMDNSHYTYWVIVPVIDSDDVFVVGSTLGGTVYNTVVYYYDYSIDSFILVSTQGGMGKYRINGQMSGMKWKDPTTGVVCLALGGLSFQQYATQYPYIYQNVLVRGPNATWNMLTHAGLTAFSEMSTCVNLYCCGGGVIAGINVGSYMLGIWKLTGTTTSTTFTITSILNFVTLEAQYIFRYGATGIRWDSTGVSFFALTRNNSNVLTGTLHILSYTGDMLDVNRIQNAANWTGKTYVNFNYPLIDTTSESTKYEILGFIPDLVNMENNKFLAFRQEPTSPNLLQWMSSTGESTKLSWPNFKQTVTAFNDPLSLGRAGRIGLTGNRAIWWAEGFIWESELEEPYNENLREDWICPEDGTYKIIAVGGGQAGSAVSLKFNGGRAGQLLLGVITMLKGQVFKYRIGRRGTFLGQLAQSTIFGNLEAPSGDTSQVSAPGGGASGSYYAGGGGGYDLQKYGGRGMYGNSQTAAFDRNGGVGSAQGGPTAGIGYGAGGGGNQNGTDGVIVIMR